MQKRFEATSALIAVGKLPKNKNFKFHTPKKDLELVDEIENFYRTAHNKASLVDWPKLRISKRPLN